VKIVIGLGSYLDGYLFCHVLPNISHSGDLDIVVLMQKSGILAA
jgi:hypothetical protein